MNNYNNGGGVINEVDRRLYFRKSNGHIDHLLNGAFKTGRGYKIDEVLFKQYCDDSEINPFKVVRYLNDGYVEVEL